MKQRMPQVVGNLLVVDDDEMNRDMLSRRLARKGFDVAVAEDGAEALARIETCDFDLVLLDIMMPGIDGLQVLERVRRDRSASDLPVIMATAKGESADIVHALELGANDYVTKPLDFAVVVARVTTHLALRHATRDLASAHARMKKDLEAAAAIQHALMPADVPDTSGLRFAWRYLPCDELAGDILDVFSDADGRVGFYLLDVSGHGVPAALLSVTLNRVLSRMASESLRPVEVAARLNAEFPMNPETRQYFTIVYACVDPSRRELHWTSAAHPGPIRVDASGTVHETPAAGLAIGWFPDAEYTEQSMRLQAGDRVYMFSDGVVEAMNAAEEQFGTESIAACLRKGRSASLEASLDLLLDEVAAWSGERGADDDISLLAVEIE